MTDLQLHALLSNCNSVATTRSIDLKGCNLTGVGLAPIRYSRNLKKIDLREPHKYARQNKQAGKICTYDFDVVSDILSTMLPDEAPVCMDVLNMRTNDASELINTLYSQESAFTKEAISMPTIPTTWMKGTGPLWTLPIKDAESAFKVSHAIPTLLKDIMMPAMLKDILIMKKADEIKCADALFALGRISTQGSLADYRSAVTLVMPHVIQNLKSTSSTILEHTLRIVDRNVSLDRGTFNADVLEEGLLLSTLVPILKCTVAEADTEATSTTPQVHKLLAVRILDTLSTKSKHPSIISTLINLIAPELKADPTIDAMVIKIMVNLACTPELSASRQVALDHLLNITPSTKLLETSQMWRLSRASTTMSAIVALEIMHDDDEQPSSNHAHRIIEILVGILNASQDSTVLTDHGNTVSKMLTIGRASGHDMIAKAFQDCGGVEVLKRLMHGKDPAVSNMAAELYATHFAAVDNFPQCHPLMQVKVACQRSRQEATHSLTGSRWQKPTLRDLLDQTSQNVIAHDSVARIRCQHCNSNVCSIEQAPSILPNAQCYGCDQWSCSVGEKEGTKKGCKKVKKCGECDYDFCSDCNTVDKCLRCNVEFCESCASVVKCDRCLIPSCEGCMEFSDCNHCGSSTCEDCGHIAYCESCGADTCETNGCPAVHYCAKCYQPECNDCGLAVTCFKCSSEACSVCATDSMQSCDSCNAAVCISTDCSRKCSKCMQVTCETGDCGTLVACEGCDELQCQDCVVSCADCGVHHCTACKPACAVCDESVCPTCSAVGACAGCGKLVCKTHICECCNHLSTPCKCGAVLITDA